VLKAKEMGIDPGDISHWRNKPFNFFLFREVTLCRIVQ